MIEIPLVQDTESDQHAINQEQKIVNEAYRQELDELRKTIEQCQNELAKRR